MTNKGKNIVAWVLSVILGFVFIASGITKILGIEMQIKNFESWGYPLWLRFPVGITEIVIAILILTPKYRIIAVYAIFFWTITALITHLQAGQVNMIAPPAIFGAIAVILYFLNKAETKI